MGVLIRAAVPEDALAVAGVHVRSWQAAYRGLLSDDYLDRLRHEDRARRYDFSGTNPAGPATIVAAENGAICGFATFARARDADVPDHGELCALYVEPARWGQGIGAALLAEARARLLDQGFGNAVLWILAGNTRAERFYRRDRWVTDGAHRTASVWDATVGELRFRRTLRS